MRRMLKNVERYVFPACLEEAVELLECAAGGAAAVAGGTSLAVSPPPGVHTLVDIGRLGLEGITTSSEGVRIGACTPLVDLAHPTPLGGYLNGIIPAAAVAGASRILRNAVTLGGNLVTLHPSSHLACALLAADATLVLAGPKGMSLSLPLVEFLGNRAAHLAPGRVITTVRLPRTSRFTVASFDHLTMAQYDPGIASVAVRATCRTRRLSDLRLAVGGVGSAPVRCSTAEAFLEDRELDPDTLAAALPLVRGDLHPQSDLRGSAEYRAEMALVLVSRALCRAWELCSTLKQGDR